jgi:predicted component of type VI protein secretion system
MPMKPLRAFESMIANLIEGTFGRVFRSEVRPIELAHKLAREMDEHTTTSVARTYAPNEYSVWLSPQDRARYEGVEQEVIDELCAYLLEHARREGLALASAPSIAFHTDDALALGEFGIKARLVRAADLPEERSALAPAGAASSRSSAPASPPAPASSRPSAPASPAAPASARPPAPASPVPAAPAAQPLAAARAGEPSRERGETMIFGSGERARGTAEQGRAGRASRALLTVAGRRLLVPPRGGIIGRSRECDIVLDDAVISRRHAELRPHGDGWVVSDLGSTNGVRVNGRPVQGPQQLRSGDRLELGSTEILFELS